MTHRLMLPVVAMTVAFVACGTKASSPSGASSSSGGAGAGGGLPATCDAFTPGSDALTVCTATYLGGPGTNHLDAVGIALDGSVLVAGAVDGSDLGQTAAHLIGSGTGAVVRLSRDGAAVLGVARLGSLVTDLEVSPVSGAIAVSGDFGVALLDPEARTVLWKDAMGGTVSRVAVGSDGTVAALGGSTISLFSATGAVVGTVTVESATSVNDVAVDGASATVFATGYRQDDGGACSEYKSTFVRGYSYTGALKWTDYDWHYTDVGASGDCADTQGLALAMGKDGKLYYAGKSDGGNTVHQKDPRNLSLMAPNVTFDEFNTPYGFNKGASALGYYAQFDPATGIIAHGQFILSRLAASDTASADANAAVPNAITADENGNVFVAGDTAYLMQNHDKKTINGIPVGTYTAYEGFALVVPPDFSRRLLWTVFTKTGPDTTTGIAAAQGTVVLGAEQAAGDLSTGTLITVNAIQAAPTSTQSEGWVAVWAAP
jgi:hypothetical protein